MSTVVQPCARCGARWAVQGTPMHWCPRCRGVLLSPGPVDAPPERRNYRWVARRPDHRQRRGATVEGSTPTPTPFYPVMPRWGLTDHPATESVAPVRGLARFAGRVRALLILTAILFGLAALGEVVRYVLLLRNRTRLIDPLVLRVSDVLVVVPATLAIVAALAAAVALVGWLVDARARAWTASGSRDPRSPRSIVAGCLVPVVNLIWPGVFLLELAERFGDSRPVRVVRIWWAAWVLGGAVSAAALLWRTADSLQAEADGVVVTACTDLYAAGFAVFTMWTVRHLDEWQGEQGEQGALGVRRWVIAADPAVPVIEPVQPGARDTGARDAGTAEVTQDHSAPADEQPGVTAAEQHEVPAEQPGVTDRQHEEVVAK